MGKITTRTPCTFYLCKNRKWLMELYSARRRQTFNVWASIFTQERPWNQPFLVQGSEESNNHGKTAGYQTALPNKDNYSRIEDGELAIGCLFKTDHLPLPMIGSVLQRLLEVIMRYFGETFDKILLTLSGGPLAAQALIMVCKIMTIYPIYEK
jgi:hypothetical protein